MKAIYCGVVALSCLASCVDRDVSAEEVPREVIVDKPVVTKEKVIVEPGIVRDKDDVSEESASGNDLRYVGLTTAAAIELAGKQSLKIRVAREDGVPRMLTKDFHPDRLNLTVVKGRVTSVTRG